MKKFTSVVLGITMGVLVFGLTGCVGEPPESATMTTAVTGQSQESGTTESTSAESAESTQATTETLAPVKQDGSYTVVARAASGEFVPSEAMQTVMTGDATSFGFNQIYVMQEDDAAVTDALKLGHFYTSLEESAPTIQIKGKEVIMGDQLTLANEKSIKVEVTGLKSGSIVKVINQEGVVEEKKVMGDKYDTRVTLDQEGFYFVEVWGGSGTMIAITNPMYVTP